MTTRELLGFYYRGLAAKSNWEPVIADDFQFVGGDMTKTAPVTGKAAYIAIIQRFSRLFAAVWVREMIVEGDRALVRASYDFTFPNGKIIKGDVAEIWTARNGKLTSLTIFFDTATFLANTQPG